MELKDVMKNRKSVREFSEKQIPVEKLISIVELAQTNPSWCDSQPYKVYIATGNTLKQIKEQYLNNAINEVPSNSRWKPLSRKYWDEMPRKNMEAWTNEMNEVVGGQGEDLNKANIELFHAPAVIFLALPKNSSNFSHYDLGAFGLSLMLAAKDEGIDSIPAYTLVIYPDYLDKVLDVDPNYDIVMGIALGYEKESPLNQSVKLRVPLEKFLTIKD